MLAHPKIGQQVQIRYTEKKWHVRPPLHHKHGTVILVAKKSQKNHLIVVDGVKYVVPTDHLFKADVIASTSRKTTTKKRKKTGRVYWYGRNKHDPMKHFWFDEDWINQGIWHHLEKSGKAILPVLLSFPHDKWNNPSELYIASMTGLSPQTVRRGFKALEGFPGLEIEAYRTRLGHIGRQFKYIREDAENELPFFDSIISSGVWYSLPMVSKCLYPVMRSRVIRFDPEEYEGELSTIDELSEYCGESEWESDFEYEYFRRWFDICDTNQNQLCIYAGIHRDSFHEAISNLIENFLVRVSDSGGYLVFLRPHHFWKAKFMNDTINTDLSKYYSKY